MKHLRGSKAVVTGAGAGIGRAIATALAEQGVDLWLVDIDEPALEAVADELRLLEVEVVTTVCDLAQAGQIAAMVENIQRQWGTLNILINNAGLCYYGPMMRMTAEHREDIMAVNLLAPIHLTHALLPLLSAQGDAHVVNICSMFGLVTYRKAAIYQASKFGLVGFTEALRAEYAGTGLGFTAVCPGFVRGTDFFQSMEHAGPHKRDRTPPAWLCCTPQQVARRTVRAMQRNSALVVMTPLARLLWWVKRLSPWLVDAFMQWTWGHSARRKRRLQVSSEQQTKR